MGAEEQDLRTACSEAGSCPVLHELSLQCEHRVLCAKGEMVERTSFI